MTAESSKPTTVSLTRMSPTERYRAVADRFGATVRGVRDWDAPTPVAEWRARDVVGHLTTWVPPMIGGGSGLDFDTIPSVEDDPVAAWTALDRRLTEMLEDPEQVSTRHTNPHTGERSVGEAIDQFVTSDIVFHTWDLARASGQDDALDEEFIAGAYDGMQQMGDSMIRGSGQFGEQQPVPEDASTQEKFFAFLGRDPRWAPPAPRPPSELA